MAARRQRESARDDLGIECGAGGDALGGLEEVVDIKDAVLQQIAAPKNHSV
jgi:hypothetical protein